MSEVLIIARTRMKNGKICVGAIDLETGRKLRLLTTDGSNFHEAATFQPGHIWRVTYTDRRTRIPPHIEDVCIRVARPTSIVVDVHQWLSTHPGRLTIWNDVADLYDGVLTFTQRSRADSNSLPHPPYVEWGKPLPSCSLGLWLTDRLLVRREERRDGNARLRYDCVETGADDISMSLPHTGFGKPPLIIPAGSLVSLSLARWWAPEGLRRQPERCHVLLCDVLSLAAPSHAAFDGAGLDLSDVPF